MYGNSDLEVGTPDRPLVTLLLVAYNQEEYVAEAIEGAFAQTYSPLEIILSDDCSPDTTFAIMEKMANDYRGPHKVLLVKRLQNLGLIDHLNDLFERANGDIMMLAAGDDVSLPHRAERLANVFVSDKNALLVHSDATGMNRAGALGALEQPPISSDDPNLANMALASKIYIGATAAIRRDLIRTFGRIQEKGSFEDLVMGFRATALGGMRYLAQPLVHYRVGIGLSSHGAGRKSYGDLRLRHTAIMIATLNQRYADLRAIECPEKDRLLRALTTEIARLEAVRAYHHSATGTSPLAYARKAVSLGRSGLAEALRHARFALRQRID